jgi:hypothetical protein
MNKRFLLFKKRRLLMPLHTKRNRQKGKRNQAAPPRFSMAKKEPAADARS